MPPITYQNFDLSIELIDNTISHYRSRVLSSPAGEAFRDFTLPFTEQELKSFFGQIGQPHRSVRILNSAEGLAAVTDFGRKLFDAVFQGDVRDLLKRSLDMATQQACGLRIRLRLAPALVNLPWEYLYDSTSKRFFVNSTHTPIIRYLELPQQIEPLAVQAPLKILVMIANPDDYIQLDVQAEWHKIQGAVAELEKRGLVQLTRLEKGTLSALQRQLRHELYHIFHYIGHGVFDSATQEGVLLLEDEHGHSSQVAGHYLGILLHDHPSLRLAILNTCDGARTSSIDSFSGVAQHLIQQNIPAVIAMQFEITDTAAITLTHEFYMALVANCSVETALAEARKRIFTSGNEVEWGTPVLYLRAQDGQIFEVTVPHQFGQPEQYPAPDLQLSLLITEYINWHRVQNERFQWRLQNETASNAAFKQVLNVADDQVKLIERGTLWAELDTWLSAWRKHKIFVLLGEEGDGKTWGVAAWLNRKISENVTFPPVVFLPAADVLSNRPAELLLKVIESHEAHVSTAQWQDDVRRWLEHYSVNMPTLILVLDGINEWHTPNWWRILIESLVEDEASKNEHLKDKYTKNIAIIVTCRTEYWQRNYNGLRRMPTVPFVLQPYNDNELDQALNLNHLKRSDFPNELLTLVRKPRYFDLAITYRNKIGTIGEISVARLIYEDWRHKWERKSNVPISHIEFRELLRQLAEKQLTRTRLFKSADLNEIIKLYPNHLILLEDLKTGRGLEIDEHHIRLNEHLLAMGLGLLLADQLIEAYEDPRCNLMEIASSWLERNAGTDISAQICEMAVVHALPVPGIAQKVKVTLLLVWLNSQNLGQDIETKFTTYLLDNIDSYLELWERISSHALENQKAQELLMSAFLHWYPQSPHIRNALEVVIERWLGMVHVAGFPSQRGNESERTEEVKKRIIQRVGFDLQLGHFTFAGRALTAIDDDDLLDLGRTALAIISHFPRNQFVHSIANGCLAEVIMGRHEKGELVQWVLSTAPESIWLEVQNEVNDLLAFDSLITKQAAHRLLSFEGSNHAYQLQQAFPADLFPVHFLLLEREKDPCLSWFSWDKVTCEMCIRRTDLETQYIARRMESHALDPALNVPDELRQHFVTLAETISTEQIWSTMATSVQDLAFEQFESALCAFAPYAISDVVRQIVQHIHTRNDFALRQISFRLREHALLFEQDEMQSIYQAWESLCHCLTTWSEEQEFAEMMLFSLVLLNLNADKQLDHLLNRRETAADLIQYENYFLPIEDWTFVEDLIEKLAAEHNLQRLLWFISVYPQQIPNDFLATHIFSYVKSSEPQIRCLAMKIIHNSNNQYVNYAIIGCWAKERDSLDEEIQRGSLILCEYGQLLSYEELCRRVHPSYWGYAVQCRGVNQSELNLFAEKIHALWQHVSHQMTNITSDFPKTAIEVGSTPNHEKGERSLLSIPRSHQASIRWQAAEQTLGGNGQTPNPFFIFPTEEEINAQRTYDIATVRTLTEQEIGLGNPWFARRFHLGALEDALVMRPELLEQWLNAVGEENASALSTLQRCHSFYEALCMVLLKYMPEKGVNLYLKMAQVNIISRDSRTQWQLLDRVLFRTSPNPIIADLWEDKLQNCKTDAQLLALTSMMQWGMGKEWLWSYIAQQLETDTPISTSRAITLLGFYDTDAAQERLTELYRTTPDTWIKQLLETSIQRGKLNIWSRHWFSRIFSSESRVDAWAAFRLFLRCVDSRFWIWYEQTKEIYSEHPDFERRGQHIEINWETIRKAIQKNEDSFQTHLFGQKILRNQAWPWM